MKITEVKLDLQSAPPKRLRAMVTVTFDECFIVRDIQVVQGVKGISLTMPCRRITRRCDACRHSNDVLANFCNHCGRRLTPERGADLRRAEWHVVIAHPLNRECQRDLRSAILAALRRKGMDV